MRSNDSHGLVLCIVAAVFLAGVGIAVPVSSSVSEPLDSLAWLAGDWEGDDAGTLNQERWMEPAGGMMLAVHRDLKGGKAVSFEFLRIEGSSDGITYIAQPRGQAPTAFPMIENGPGGRRRVVFENPSLEFPRRILYWMEKDGELHARIEGTPGGKPKAIEWTWRKRVR
jgi:hypothetical protein